MLALDTWLVARRNKTIVNHVKYLVDNRKTMIDFHHNRKKVYFCFPGKQGRNSQTGEQNGKKINYKTIVITGMFAAVITVLAQIAIPMPLRRPHHTQTFAIALTGAVLEPGSEQPQPAYTYFWEQ